MTRKVALFGDSLLKGIVIDEESNRYLISNAIAWREIEHHLNIKIDNQSRMGATITYGFKKIKTYLKTHPKPDVVLIEYGGNDCDYDWVYVANNKSKNHLSKTEPKAFRKTLSELIDFLINNQIEPVLMTLPPIDPNRYYHWISKQGLNQDNLMYFLGDVQTIYRHHELYNQIIHDVAYEKCVRLIDVRQSFLGSNNYHDLMCIDGIHLNENGHQKVIDSIYQALSIDAYTNRSYAEKTIIPQSLKNKIPS